MPTAKVTKNVSAAIGGGNVLCSTLISIKTKAWLYSFRFIQPLVAGRTDTCIRLMQHTDAAVSFSPVMAYLAAVVRTAVID